MKEGNGRRRDGEDFELEFEVIECDGDFVVFLGDRVPKWPHVDKFFGTLQMYMAYVTAKTPKCISRTFMIRTIDIIYSC